LGKDWAALLRAPVSRTRTEPSESAEPRAERDDEVLAARALADPEALRELYQRYIGPVYRFCHLRLGSHERAEDAASEVFLRVVKGLPSYRPGSFAGWVFQIARRVVIDAYRSDQRLLPIEAAEESLARYGLEAAVADSLEIDRALAELPDDSRLAVEAFLAGWPDDLIAGALGRSPGAVRVLRFRAIRRLREMLHDEDGGGRGR
jgi:RNA polymerase sigma-70 factor (ECF subfamily)